MTTNSYYVGQKVRTSVVFTDTTTGNPADPQDVFFEVRSPAGTIVQYHYGVDIQIVKDSVGNYHVDVDANLAGNWTYRFYATGTGQSANEKQFYVQGGAF